ncbi:MAG TPA: LuxR C-terminal-related transcriptional regulator [Streptosporangiaceae bacterium]|nr:LuxR C-terminal-related transcriptional regulator [Streptosporangiaceae bacterium]
MTSVVGGPAVSMNRHAVAGSLLADKLRIPRPGVAVLARPRLTARIEAAVGCRVTLITGPPGAGKTMAAAQWAAARPAPRRPAWVTLDAADAEPARFWGYLTAALSAAGIATLPEGVRPDDVPHWLATAVPATALPVVLVLDDVGVIAGSEALAGLDELIRHEPAGLRLVLVGRSAPALGLARLRLAGELAEIGAAELACTSEETAAYFDMVGRPLRPAERDEVIRRTEGWLAGLRLTVLSAQADRVTAQALVADYVQDEVLGPLPADVRRFLQRTCLTESVPAPLASELTGDPAAAQVLDGLSRAGSLVAPVAPDAGEYRYHPMLRDVLTGCLRRELPEEVPELQRRVARWHAAHGDVAAAVRAAADVGDWDFGGQVLRQAGPSVMLSADGPAVEEALAGAPPDWVAGEATPAMALAAGRLWQGDADGALPHLEGAQHALAGLADAERGQAELWLAALHVLYRAAAAGPGAAGPGWLDAERTLASRAQGDPRGRQHEALGLLWLALGFAALRSFDVHRARSALLRAGSQLSAGGLLALREHGRCWEAVAAALYGDLAAASRLTTTVADGPHGRDGELVPVLALAGAVVSLGRDELDEAAALLDQAQLAAMAPRPAGEPSIALLSGLLRARLAVADGNLPGARGLVRWLTDAAAGSVQLADLPAVPGLDAGSDQTRAPDQALGRPRGAAAAVALLDAEISLAAGERERARARLAELAGPAGGPPADPVTRAEVAVGQARLLIAEEDDKAALKLVEPVLAEPAGSCSTTDRIMALLTAVIAHRRLSQPGEAAELLSQALALAEPDEACGPFLAAGSAVRSALTVLISPSNRCAGFAARILDRFDGRLARPVASQPAALLTDSELAVLRFLPSHMTNQEIAESLFLSINTIKTHLSSVYRKLGVANRRQAIAQGRRLELLLRRADGGYAGLATRRLDSDRRVSARLARHRLKASPPSTRP